MPNYNVYIPQKYEEILETYRKEDESIGQCAKRLLLDLLDQKSNLTTSTGFDENAFKELQERLEAIEVAIKAERPPDRSQELGELIDRIKTIEDRLTAIESHGSSPPIFPGDQPITDHGQWVICLTLDDKPVKYWTGSEWAEEISIANRYQSETSLKRTLEKLKTRKQDDPTTVIRYNTIANLERILESEK